ncbi:MAG TPA: helix-turn-helix domain-containing protein, partial [Reyranella sp.]|nr:helix-turn-helix domain-containing protein [Reyranella sp.]
MEELHALFGQAQARHAPAHPESARRLFNSKGFAEVSIDEIMENAGLTHGGFYRDFKDKGELYAEAVRRSLC